MKNINPQTAGSTVQREKRNDKFYPNIKSTSAFCCYSIWEVPTVPGDFTVLHSDLALHLSNHNTLGRKSRSLLDEFLQCMHAIG